MNLSYSFNLAGGMHGSDDHYEAARAGASRHWDAWRGAAFVGVPLPQDWPFRGNLSFQESSKILVPAEQFGIGGASSVRGYAERAVARDQGYIVNLELYTPDFGKHLADNIKSRGVFFIDHGAGRNNDGGTPLPITLRSAGVGLRLNYGKDLAIKADVAVSLSPSAEQNGANIETMPQRQAWSLKSKHDNWGLHLSAKRGGPTP